MSAPQPGILADVPLASRYLFLHLRPDADPSRARAALAGLTIDESLVVGVGSPLAVALGLALDDLRPHPAWIGPGVSAPSTQTALWLWLRGEDRGALLHRGRELCARLADSFELAEIIEAFRHREGHDLTGYEDGTENPKGDEAKAAAFDDMFGSYVAVQRWVHDLGRFDAMSAAQRDHAFGRRVADNEELDDAPDSAHVKRTAQESFTPEAFVLRRSMPWTEPQREGLVFVAFGCSLGAYEALLWRMLGKEDGVVDALFGFTRPVSGGYYYCPGVEGATLVLR